MNTVSNRIENLLLYDSLGGINQYEGFLLFIIYYYGIEVEHIDYLETCLLRTNGERVGELIHIADGTITRTLNGIWHNNLQAYI